MNNVHPFIPMADRDDAIDGVFQSIAIDLSSLPSMDDDGAMVTRAADGVISEIDFEPQVADAREITEEADDHYANLAPFLSSSDLNNLANDVHEMVMNDIDTRRPWVERMARGLKMLGLVGQDKEPIKGRSGVVHPLLSEAIVQFQSRAGPELFPSTGPAKAVVVGEKTKEKSDQAERVKDYLNYQSTIEDEDYYDESDRLLFLSPFEGSVFRKCYHDPITNNNVRRLVRAEHMIVPYSATSLQNASRYTHVLMYSQDEMKELQTSGFFVDAPLATPSSAGTEVSSYDAAKDEAEGKTNPSRRDEDNEHTVYEVNLYCVIPGFHEDEKRALPYVVTIERDSMKVLAIRRAWEEDDDLKRRDVQMVHYVFIRGDGFYGYGLIHLAGGIGDAATDLLQSILDSAAFSGLQSGFKAKEAKFKAGVELEPGKFIETELSADELKNAFHSPPFKEVPMSLVSILGVLVEAGQRFVSTTEATIGDANNTGPVGTTVALIEQGSKVHTAIHRRLHVSLGKELRILAKLNGKYLSEDGYPYAVGDDSRVIYRKDFDSRVDVIPVSDPNIFSQTQRIAIAQTQVQLADANPDMIDRRTAYKRMLEAIGAYDVDELMPDKKKIDRCDPVTENALAMVGRPIKSFADQNHDAHIAVHMGQLQLAQAQGLPGLEMFQQAIVAHVQEHMAINQRMKMSQMIGMPLPPMMLDAEPGSPTTQPLPHEVENQIAVSAAQATQQLLQQLAQATSAPQQQQPQDAVSEATKDQQVLMAEKRKEQQSVAEERRKDMRLMAEVERSDAAAGIDPKSVKEAREFLMSKNARNDTITARRLAVFSRELGLSFDRTLELLMSLQSAGQGQGPSPIAESMG